MKLSIFLKSLGGCILVGASFLLSGCDAFVNASIDQMIINIANVMPQVMAMVTGGAYVIGLISIISGVYQMRVYGELRTMTASQSSIMPPLIKIAVGALLLYFPTAMNISLMTLFGYNSPIAYPEGNDPTVLLTAAVIDIIQVIGVISFIRGMLFFQKAGTQGAQPGTVSRGFTHVIAGICAINAYGFWEVLENTLLG